MIEEALKLLEFDRVKELFKPFTFSENGKKHIDSMRPLENPFEELSLLEGMIELIQREDIPVSHDFNVSDLVHRLLMGETLDPKDLLRFESFARGCGELKLFSKKIKHEGLKNLFSGLKNLDEIVGAIRKAISEDGEVKDDASKRLFSIRTRKRTILEELKRKSERLKERYRPYLQEEIVIVRDGRYMLPVKASSRPKVRGIVHHTSSSGATVYIEPEELVPLNDEKRIVEEEERREVHRILREISNLILSRMNAVKENLSIVSQIDSLYARANYAIKKRAIVVYPNGDGEIRLVEARHPLIPEDRVVPISLRIPKEKRGLVITGPNMGGKTVTLKTIGLFTAMAMSGFPVPASEGTKLSIFSKILVDIGEEQSIELSLSTFSSHMKRIVKILKEASEDSLVLIDELGTGTDPMEGSALALAIVEELLKKGCKFVVTTHMTPLKLFAIEREEVESASVEFDPKTLKPTYRVLMGVPGASHAFEIASSLGLDEEIIERARKHLSGESVEVEAVIRKLQSEVKMVRSEREKLEIERKRLERERKKFQEKYEKLKSQKIEEMDRELKELTDQVDDVMKKLEEAIHALKKKREEDLKRAVKSLMEGKKKLKEVKISSGSSHEITVGSHVRLKGGTAVGVVVREKDGKVLVDFGTMKIEVPKSSLVPAEPPKVERKTTEPTEIKVLEKPEIDIRGMTVEEAESVILDFIDKLVLSDFERGYIIHGKGTGRLAAGVWEILRRDPRVKNYRFGTAGEGGTGVTVVEV